MISREELLERRDELMERRDAMMERAERIREQFMDRMDADVVGMAVGLSLVSGGIAWGMNRVMRGRRGAMSVVAPVGLVALGLVLAGRGAMSRRALHIGAAEARVRGELSGLDPFARSKVLKDLATGNIPFVRHSHN